MKRYTLKKKGPGVKSSKSGEYVSYQDVSILIDAARAVLAKAKPYYYKGSDEGWANVGDYANSRMQAACKKLKITQFQKK